MGRGTVRPLTRVSAELDGPKAAMPPVPTSSGGSGTPGESCQPRGTELGCVLSSPHSASLCAEPSGGHSAAPAPAGMCPRSRTGGRCPGGPGGDARPPAASPLRVLGDPIISAAVRPDDVMWALFFFFLENRD